MVLAASPAAAQTFVSVPGTFNSEMGCSGDWDPACGTAQLFLGGDGLWHRSSALPTGSFEYKIAYDQSWDVNYGVGGTLGGANYTLDVTDPGTTVHFSYDPTTHLATTLLAQGQPAYVALPGGFNSEIGCAGDWDPYCGLAQMTLSADGLWYASYLLPTGDYEFKIAYDRNWDENYGVGGMRDGANMSFSVADPSTVYFRYDPTSHLTDTQFSPFQAAAVPEPSTWAMMLLGFGAAGLGLRRQRRFQLA